MSRLERLDLVAPRRWYFAVSGVLVVASLVLLLIPPALRPGIEFTSGTTSLMRFENPVDQAELRAAYADLGHPEARVQSTGENEYLVRTSELEVPETAFIELSPATVPDDALATAVLGASEDATGDVTLHAAVGGDVCQFGAEIASFPVGTEARVFERFDECEEGEEGEGGTVLRVAVDNQTGLVRLDDVHAYSDADGPAGQAGGEGEDLGERGEIEAALQERFGSFEVLEFSAVSEVVSQAAVRNAALAVVIASVFIMAYIAFAFSSLPRPLRYGTAAMVALAHDVIIVLGVFSLLGKVAGVEVNLMFVTGLLTVIGFSVHDSIVVFDRMRENIQQTPNLPLARNTNAAIVQTIGRSLNTSMTLIFTILALLFLGGVTIREFLLVMLVGVAVGTYSSIGIAAQVLVAWDAGDFGRWFGRRRRSAASSEA